MGKDARPLTEHSDVGDLTSLVKDLEDVFLTRFPGRRPAMAIAFTLPPEYRDAHWATNVAREDGIKLFEETARKMKVS